MRRARGALRVSWFNPAGGYGADLGGDAIRVAAQ
jgi:hypothetical protein